VLKQHSQLDFYIASSLKQQSFDVFDIDTSFTQIYILVNGDWTNYTEWSKWTECSESCGNGMQKSTHSRSCTNPEPKFNGQQCAGEVTEERSQICKIKDCPGKIDYSFVL
jgi:hypothetical protein